MSGLPAELRVLTDYRDQLVAERAATTNRVHTDLGWLRPGYQHQLPKLTSAAQLHAALLHAALLADDSGVRPSITCLWVERMAAITSELHGLRGQIADLVADSGTTLTGIYGIGPLVAARILAEVHDVRRFPSRHHFTTANGSPPIAASSGRTVRHRLNRGGYRLAEGGGDWQLVSGALVAVVAQRPGGFPDGRAHPRPRGAADPGP